MSTVPMSVQDALWLTMDRPNNLMVVDGAMVMAQRPTLDDVKAVFADAVAKFPVFGRKAVPDGLGWAWQDDPEFDMDRHIHEATLEEPADMAALQQFLAERRSDPLPKDRPLWQAFLVAPVNLADGTEGAALVSRFHHAIADGVRLTQVLLGMCEDGGEGIVAVVAKNSKAPESGGTPGLSGIAENTLAVAGQATSAVTHSVSSATGDVAHAVRHPLHAMAHLPGRIVSTAMGVVQGAGETAGMLTHPDRMLDALEVLGVENFRPSNDLSSVTKIAFANTTKTVWTGHPGSEKAIAWSEPIPLSDIKAIGKAAGATVNDVLLSAVAGGLRRYLVERGGLIDEVVWMVPVNLKPFADNLPPDLGNYFALVFVPMPLTEADPDQRLPLMHQRMNRIKNSDEAVITFGLQRVVSQSPGKIAYFLTNFFANKSIGVLTNVPGPRGPVTFAGVPVVQIVGFAPCSGDQPMTATIFSYNGAVTVGFASDASLLPDPDVLAEHVVAELAGQLEALPA